VQRRVHKLTFDESERDEVALWQANLREPLKSRRFDAAPPPPPPPPLEAEVATLSARELAGVCGGEAPASLAAVRARFPHTMPAALLRAAFERRAQEPLRDALLRMRLGGAARPAPLPAGAADAAEAAAAERDVAALTAPPGADEAPLLADEDGRKKLLAGGRAALEAAQRELVSANVAVDALADAGFPADCAPVLELSAARARARAAAFLASLGAFRLACLAHYARSAARAAEGPAEAAAFEADWLAGLGIALPEEQLREPRPAPRAGGSPKSGRAAAAARLLAATPAAFPRIPADMFAVRERPLEAPLTLEERRNDTHQLDRSLTKRFAMEHRDRAELIPRRRLPTPLHADAPTPQLEAAARALEENRSLSAQDREYMLHIYARAVAQTKPEQLADETRLLDEAERKAWVDPQPQWGWYDPRLARLQDDVEDALKGRGQFSAFRGDTFRDEFLSRPELVGEAAPGEVAGVPAGTPLDTAEEAALAAEDAEARWREEGAAVEAAVTRRLERELGLPSRSGKAPPPPPRAAKPSFFKRLAVGEAPPVVAVPPETGNRIELPRLEVGGAAAAAAAPAKGGKPAAKSAAKK